MVLSTWDELTGDLNEHDYAMIARFRELGTALPDAELQVHRTEAQFRRARIFTSAYVKNHYLEVGVDLLREATHPKLRTAFPTTKKVTTHRLTFRDVAELDDDLAALIEEAYETVGPGTR